jgi:hypothetical protein
MSALHRSLRLLIVLAVSASMGKTAAGAEPPRPAERSSVQAACRWELRTLDVTRSTRALIARIELFSADGLSALDPAGLEPGVFITSVGRTPLPSPTPTVDGIGELRSARTIEDSFDVRGGGRVPNGIREAVIRFTRPSDGDPVTPEDGNADDVAAMLSDVPDGQSVPVCLAGRFAGVEFTCCDRMTVRNRGFRDLPPALPGTRGTGR